MDHNEGATDIPLLRDYQIEVINKFFELKNNGIHQILLQAPCGSGKTVMAAEIIRQLVLLGFRVLFLAHRRELVDQASDKLIQFRVEHGILMAGKTASLLPDTQIASIQTLLARIKRGRIQPPPGDLIVFDECHHAKAKSYSDLLDKYPGSILLGLTATPARGDGRGLGDMFKEMICAPGIPELTESGHLVPTDTYAPSKPDLENLRIRAGDYIQEGLANRMDTVTLVGDIVENWGRICPDRKTIVFSTSVKHSIHIRDRFRDAGIVAEHIDANTPIDERKSILNRLASGDVQVVSNVMVLTEGWDCKPVSCCILARPTKSLGLYLQMAGRILRPSPGKKDAIILDHSGAVFEHGLINQDIYWALEPGEKIQDRQASMRKKSDPIVCEECEFIYTKQLACPKCGHKPVRKGRSFKVIDGKLGRVVGKNVVVEDHTPAEKTRIYLELKFIQQERGYKEGWTSWKFKSIFGSWPRKITGDPLQPSIEIRARIRRDAIDYAKSKNTAYL